MIYNKKHIKLKEDVAIDMVPQQIKAGASTYGDIKIQVFLNGSHHKILGSITIPKDKYEFLGNTVIVNPEYRSQVEKEILNLLKNQRLIVNDIPFEYDGKFKISAKDGAIELSVSKNRIKVMEV